MKEQWLSKLENYLTDALKGIIHVPYRLICTYHDKILSVTLINQTSGKSYLIATVRGRKDPDKQTYIELFYVMPHFQGCGIGRTILDYYSQIQIAEGEDEIHLKPLPFLPESRNPLEYFRLYTWLGGKNHTLMTRRQLIRFYQSAGFEPMRPSDITSGMQRQLA